MPLLRFLACLCFACFAAARPPRPPVVVFWAEGFPAPDRGPLAKGDLAEALKAADVRWVAEPQALVEALSPGALLVLPHGSAFPLEAWGGIRAHLEQGGRLLALGGAPFHVPVRRTPAGWKAEAPTPAFAQALRLGPAEAVAWRPGWRVEGRTPGLPLPLGTRAFALTPRLADRPLRPAEEGSQGETEAVLRPLAHWVDGEGIPRACPALEWEGLGGRGRWVLAPFEGPFPAELLRALADRALAPSYDWRVEVSPACVLPGEAATLRVTLHRPGGGGAARVWIEGLGSRELLGGEWLRGEWPLPAGGAPGLHRLRVRLEDPELEPDETTAGYWVRDEALLRDGPPLQAGGDWLRLDGKPRPIVGTTYMDGEAHRAFLLDPHPARWDEDFAAMARAGVNLVRTGIWSGWDALMAEPGPVNGAALRALDAFLLTAARHRIHVCFTFFAFQPPAFGGANPYLDPRARAGQRALLEAVAARYRGSPWIHYDLINEPSYGPRPWSHRPYGDALEAAAWRAWLAARTGGEAERRAAFQDAQDPTALPLERDFAGAAVRDGRRPRKAAAFAEFAQGLVREWAGHLRETLRGAAGPPTPLVTLGQDEGGLGTRPAPPFHGDAVDFTCMHNWWANDDLLYDSLAAKLPGRPMLVQETGLMRLEDVDGRPWRSAADAARLLERKLAHAFLGRGAGAVQWAWQVNPLMPLENEAAIGIWRPDGTAKPELDVLRAFARFAREAAPHLGDFRPAEVGILVPHGRLFLGRPRALEGAQRLVRVLSERFGLAPRLLSDLRPLDLAGLRLLILPSPEWEPALAAPPGLTVLRLGPQGPGGPTLAKQEATPWGWATFDGLLGQGLRQDPVERRIQGPELHEPLPLEYAREEEPLRTLLAQALKAAGMAAAPARDPLAWIRLPMGEASLEGAVNETGRPLRPKGASEALAPGRAALELRDADGRVRVRYEGPALD